MIKTPEVVLVPTINKKGHPLGCYIEEENKICLSLGELKLRTAEERRYAVFHELGHWWRCSMVPRMHTVHDEEEFADCFAFFFIEGGVQAESYDENTVFCFENSDVSDRSAEITSFGQAIYRSLEDALTRGFS